MHGRYFFAMYNIFISVPMRDRTDSEIADSIIQAMKDVLRLLSYDKDIKFYTGFVAKDKEVYERLYEAESNLQTTLYTPAYYEEKHPLGYLGRSISVMQHCNYIYSCPGWINARGCRAEYAVAHEYDIRPVSNYLAISNGFLEAAKGALTIEKEELNEKREIQETSGTGKAEDPV